LIQQESGEEVNDDHHDSAGNDRDLVLYRIARVSELLAVSRSRVYELIASGQLPSVKIGASRRVSASQLREFLALQSQ
jgi:excisionase family DNA binding protein